jgi:hypothetical protein
MGAATARAPLETPEALNVPLFRQLMQVADPAMRRVVLDLGAVSSPLLALLGRGSCCVQVANLADDGGIARMNAESDRVALVAMATRLLPARATNDAVDLVLCWDLLNYLKPAATTALMDAVAARARPGALVHALIVYSERLMPAHPGRFIPSADCKLLNRAATKADVAAPRYSPVDLQNILGNFAIEHARLLANGMQEFIFRLRA